MRNNALLTVKVPADAKVFINDRPTPSTGVDREYISRNLQSGAQYNYVVRVEYIRDGQAVSENKTVQMTAGQTANLDFAPTIVQATADAIEYLAVQETKFGGLVCEFSSVPSEPKGPAVTEKQACEQAVVVSTDETHQAGAALRSSRATSSNWLVVLSFGGAAFGVFAWRRRHAVHSVRSQAA